MTSAELNAAGVSDARIRTLMRRGVLLQQGHGIYARALAVSKLADTERERRAVRMAAAVVLAGPAAAVSHHDAAVLHVIALLDRPPAEVSISRPPGQAGSRRGGRGVRLHIAELPRGHVTVAMRVPVTSAARTVVDLARTTSFRSGVVAADSALHEKRTSKAELGAVIEMCPRWPGIVRARQVVSFSDERSESPFESISRVAFRDGGLPPPDLQAWVGGVSRVIGRVDFLWPEHATIAEADGAIKYADPVRARQQLHRDARLREAGFEVVHFTWRELMSTPDQVVNSIKAAFRRTAAIRAAERLTANRQAARPGGC